MDIELKKFAHSLVESGLNVVPVQLLTKAPVVRSWKQLQTEALTPVFLDSMLKHTEDLNGDAGLALVTGKYGENETAVICMDFDNKLQNAKELFVQFINTPEVADIFKAKGIPYIESSQSGGYHIFFRSEQGHNSKLAQDRAIDGKIYTTIETREDGGYCIVAPSKGYKAVKGDLKAMPVLTAEEKAVLYSYARSFNMVVDDSDVKQKKTESSDALRPGDAFNSHIDSDRQIKELLIRHGWKHVGNNQRGELWRRPGKNTGVSATYNGDVFLVFSTNAMPFDLSNTSRVGKGFSKFQVLTLLAYNGDYTAAAKALFNKGYGNTSRTNSSPATVNSDESVIAPEESQEEEQTFFIKAVVSNRGELSYKIDFDLYHKFLREQSFFKFIEGEDFFLVRVQNSLVDQVQLYEVANFCKRYIEENFEQPHAMIDYMIANEKKLFEKSKLAFLPTLEDDFNMDTWNEGWLYFKNIAVKIKRDVEGFELFEYSELPKPIWRKELIDHVFDVDVAAEENKGDIEKFVENICNHDETRKNRLMSAIGYLLHTYKTGALSRCIIFSDEQIPESEDDANGGTGKSLLGLFISQYRNTVKKRGKDAFQKGNTQFAFQDVGHETRIMFYDDITKDFPLDQIFSEITGDLRVERKNQHPFVIPYKRSPKFLITTNYAVKGTGSSYERRKYEVELYPYYNERRTPISEFGREFFHGWDEKEQSRADLFAIDCLSLYINNGLVDLENKGGNARIRQAIAETKKDFVEFLMQEFYRENIVEFIEFDRKKVFEQFKSSNADYADLRLQTFSKWLNKLAMIFRIPIKNRRSDIDCYTLLGGKLKAMSERYYQSTGSPTPKQQIEEKLF